MPLSLSFFDELATDGWVSADGVLDAGLWRSWSAVVPDLPLKPAAIGRGAGHQRRGEIRGDSTYWLEDGDPSPTVMQARAWLEEWRHLLNRELRMGLRRSEAHFALYPAGAGYDLHVDQARGHGARRISLLLYLNENWQPGDGGELELHLPDEPPRIIEPRGGRLVLFRSADVPHRVRETAKARKSLTAWFRDDGP